MLNEKKIEEIRKNIQTSTLLSDHEKSDWLNLLELMNDKQLSELEEILASGGPASAAGQATTSAADQLLTPNPSMPPIQAQKPPVNMPPLASKMPPLTHIANIPTDVSMRHEPLPVPPKSNQTTPTIPTSKNVSTPITTPASVAEKPKSTVGTTTEIPKRPTGVTQPRLKIEQAEEIKSFSLETLRTNDLQSVVDAVRNQIEQHGYFKIVQLLEASPLYDSYINSGKERLKSNTSNPISNNYLLTQEELEFMTDLLRHIRFNRW